MYPGVSCISKLLFVPTYENIAMKSKNPLVISYLDRLRHILARYVSAVVPRLLW